MKSDKTPSEMLSLRVPQSVINDLDAAAEKNNRTRSKEALYRLKHYPVPLTPALMADLENKKNQQYGELKPDMPQEALDIYEEVAILWRQLK